MPDPAVPGPPAAVLAQISSNPGSDLPLSNAVFTGRATFSYANAGAFPTLPSLMTEIVAMPQSAFLDADVEVGGNLVVDGTLSGAAVSGGYLRSPTVITSGTFTTTSATLSALSAGTVGTGLFTAPSSGEVVVEVDLVSNVTGADAIGFALAATTTVTPVVGHVVTAEPSSSVPYNPYHLVFPVTGLTVGNSYNYDVLFGVTNSATVSVAAVGVTSTTVAAGNKGGPVTVTVKAV